MTDAVGSLTNGVVGATSLTTVPALAVGAKVVPDVVALATVAVLVLGSILTVEPLGILSVVATTLTFPSVPITKAVLLVGSLVTTIAVLT